MTTTDTSAGLQATRPRIVIGGNEDVDLSQGLLRMSFHETVQGLTRAELRFGNWGLKSGSIGFLFFDRQKLDFGKAMQVKLDQDLLFEGRVSAIEADFGEGRSPELAVLLEDRFQDLRMTRRTRSFSDQTDAAIFQQIARDHGLQPNVDVSGPQHKHLAQVNQSDLAFMRERARAVDAELWLDDTNLHAQPRTRRNGTTIKLKYGADLREFNVVADLATQRSSVKVAGWSVADKKAIEHEAGDDTISGELGSDTSGASILGQKFGSRKEAIAHTVPLTDDDAKSESEAYFRMAARRFLVGSGVAQPNAKLRVGTYVDLDGVGPLFNGKYYLAEVKHVFDGTAGFRSEFMGERPGLGQAQ
ncbi:MAG TPA: contractile injection system protein, VgrG/Pvc8 family [Thermoanaerobaculia bacterium]|nr:contractile injection system protein, VgrG/Pvc8 family [Thermoanaerobaculia bacterium]